MNKIIQLFILHLCLWQIADGQADLTMMGTPTVTAPNWHIGTTITISVNIKNIGNATSSVCRNRIFYSPTSNYSDALLFADVSLEALAAGETDSSIQFVHPIPYTFTGGTYYFFIEINHFGDAIESNYFNNESVLGPFSVDPAPWAAQNIPYPIIFVHGYMSSDSTWFQLIDSLRNNYGWSYGGNMDFCLNQDGDVTTSVLSSDYYDFINDVGHALNPNPCDFYTINFANNPSYWTGSYDNFFESNQAGITKQGRAVQDAIKHVLAVTGKDKVILVCHSMGGLAAREYLQNPNLFQSNDGKKHVAKLCTIGTPHGGTNIVASDLGSIWQANDGASEAIRDLRTTYFYANQPGAYLFDGAEDNAYMNDQALANFVNVDVNCNGIIGEWITGINHKSIPTDLSYSCIIGTGDAFPINGDGVVTDSSANINNFLHVSASTFILPETRIIWDPRDPWHVELTNQFRGIMQAMDEPNDNNNNHAYEVSSGQLYYGIISYQSVGSPPRDYDNYQIKIPSNGSLNIQVYNIPLTQFYINVFNSSHTSVYTTTSNGKSYVNVNTPSLTADNYFVVLSVYPDPTSWYYPYAFKVTYSAVAPSYCSGTTNLTTPSGAFSDGSGSNDYNDNSDCRWKIQPSGATSITLSFPAFDVNSSGDTVYVYDGGTTASPILLAWTGNTLPSNTTSTGGTMLVRFSSDASNTAAGWTANYTSVVVPTYCNGTTTLTAPTGSFSDGSDTSDYGNNSNCSWLISPPGAYSITLHFPLFNTESVNDVVNVYDGNDNTAPLLGSFSGTSIPDSLTSSGGAMFVEFITNSTVTASGWNASYTSFIPYSNQGIVEYEYWFDNDYGNAVSTPIMPQNIFNLNSNFPTFNLSQGLHSFHIHFKDNNGTWSSVLSNFFMRLQNSYGSIALSEYEYWLDNDYLSHIDQAISPSQFYDSLITSLPIASASQGLHSFHIRFKSNGGVWSSVLSSFFFKAGISPSGFYRMSDYRYWFDNDTANMTNRIFTNPLTVEDLFDTCNGSVLTIGQHQIHMQFEDELSLWSSVITDTFNVITTVGIPKLVLANSFSIYPNPAHDNFSLMVSQPMKNASLNIYNSIGELIYKESFGNIVSGIRKEIHFAYPIGIYFVRLNDGEKEYTQKLVIQ